MPSSVTVLCQIKSKGQEGGFVSGLASYSIESGRSKTFHYGFYKKQISLFLYDLKVADYALLCGKYVFNRGIMYVLVSAAFKIENNKDELFSTGPYASFAGKIYESVEQSENDCKFGVNLSEYNNFSFGNREKMDFKVQVVYEAGPDSRFKKLASRLHVGKCVFISGFFDLNENELPFIEAKEIDLLDEFSNYSSQNQPNINLQSPFSRANKFRTNKHMVQSPVVKVEPSSSKITEDNNDEQDVSEEAVASTSGSKTKDQLASGKTKKSNKRKKELSDLSVQRLKKAIKKTNVKTRSQKKEEPHQYDDIVLTEEEEDNQ